MMQFNIPECRCYGCWMASGFPERHAAVLWDHRVEIHAVAASVDNRETAILLGLRGYEVMERGCELHRWCKIYGPHEEDQCMGDPNFAQIEDELIQAGLPVGEELVAVLG